MSYLLKSKGRVQENMFAIAVWLSLIFGIFLPYITAPLVGPVINLPWSFYYGILPFLFTDVIGSIFKPAANSLRVIAAILSPVLMTYLLLFVGKHFELRQYRRLLTAIFVTFALMTVPASFVIDKLGWLPLYQRYVAF